MGCEDVRTLQFQARSGRGEIDSSPEGRGAPDFAPRPYIGPGQPIGIVRMDEGTRHLRARPLGIYPSWTKEVRPGRPLTNARAETVLDKPSFRNAMRRRRCLVPADGFFQWKGEVPGRKQPYFVHRPDEGLFAIAGLWETLDRRRRQRDRHRTLHHRPANARLPEIHHRMPALIMAGGFRRAGSIAPAFPPRTPRGLLMPSTDDYFSADPVELRRSRPPKRMPPLLRDQSPPISSSSSEPENLFPR